MVIKFYLIIFIICSQKKICITCVRNIRTVKIYVTHKYPYTIECDIPHKEHNWRVVQIVNTIYITIINNFKRKIK